jgi:uncharacterized repeat protein (TIGR03803 family)
LGLLFAFPFAAPQAHAGIVFTTLVSFNGTNGATPACTLLQSSDGNFYGTTEYGGDPQGWQLGTVFKMTTNGTLSILASLPGSYDPGLSPMGGLVQGANGLLYGTTSAGGDGPAVGGEGTVFMITTNGGHTATVILFDGPNGDSPRAGLLKGTDGNLYGTTYKGGGYISSDPKEEGYGTVFGIVSGPFWILHSFSGADGAYPLCGLSQGTDGNLYGATSSGTVFRLNLHDQTPPFFTNLVSFAGTTNGGSPHAAPIQGVDGSLYGTTALGWGNNGTVFRLAMNGVLTTLHSFSSDVEPQGALVQGASGSLYGTTAYGGTCNCGTLFKITTNGVFTTLVSFTGPNGANPMAGLILGSDGSLYGTTSSGGTYNSGTIFRLTLTPPAPPAFQAVKKAGTNITLTWTTEVGQAYQLQFRTNLAQATWSNWGGYIAATNSTVTVTNTPGADTRRFYRVVLLP